jgi:hypothetical protein
MQNDQVKIKVKHMTDRIEEFELPKATTIAELKQKC